MAGAIAAEATTLCTANVKNFPANVMAELHIDLMTPEVLLTALITGFPVQMRTVHAASVRRLRGATDQSTIAALRRAGAPTAPSLISKLLK